jgi:putative sugar O-methyltransferase
VIAEIGAGYGRLGHVFLASGPCRYMVFDIPPTLFVSQRYLSTLYPDKRVFRFRHFEDFDEVRAEVAESDICFFTANQLELLPESYIDCLIAIDNLQEMRAEQIARFVDLIARRTRQTVYIKNVREWTNEVDRVTVGTDDYRLNGSWRTEADRPDPVWTNYTNLVYRKA